jgi:hypothetical protein
MTECKYEFTIDNICICLNNNDRGERTLANAYVDIGPMRISVYMDSSGDVHMSQDVRDEELKYDIGIRMRELVLMRIADNFKRRDEYNLRNMHERREAWAKMTRVRETA